LEGGGQGVFGRTGGQVDRALVLILFFCRAGRCILTPPPNHTRSQALHPSEHTELQGKLKESQDRGTIEKALNTLDKVLQAQDIQV